MNYLRMKRLEMDLREAQRLGATEWAENVLEDLLPLRSLYDDILETQIPDEDDLYDSIRNEDYA